VQYILNIFKLSKEQFMLKNIYQHFIKLGNLNIILKNNKLLNIFTINTLLIKLITLKSFDLRMNNQCFLCYKEIQSLIKNFKFFIYSIRTNFETLYYIFKLFDRKFSLIGIDRKHLKINRTFQTSTNSFKIF